MTRMSPFDFVKSISEKTGNLMEQSPEAERDYVPFVVNRALSFSPDAILYANEMNCVPFADRRMQYDYLYHSLRKRKRHDRWIKASEDDATLVESIMLVHSVGRRRAMEYASLMSEEARGAVIAAKGGTKEG